MLKRNIILLFVLIVVAGSIHAQVRPGIKLGYNLSGVAASYTGTSELKSTAAGDPDNFRMKSGFQAGMVVDCPINDTWAIQPGIRFTSQGFTDKYTGNGNSVKKFALYSLQIPVYAQYRLNIAEETSLLFQAGPYVGFGLFGRQKYTRKGKSVDLNDTQKKITFGGGTSNDIHKAFDYGVGAGVGIEFYRFQFMVAYDFGLYDASFDKKDAKSASYNVDIRNHNLSITLAFIFGRRDPLQNKKD
jgi:hypothetical protein